MNMKQPVWNSAKISESWIGTTSDIQGTTSEIIEWKNKMVQKGNETKIGISQTDLSVFSGKTSVSFPANKPFQ